MVRRGREKFVLESQTWTVLTSRLYIYSVDSWQKACQHHQDNCLGHPSLCCQLFGYFFQKENCFGKRERRKGTASAAVIPLPPTEAAFSLGLLDANTTQLGKQLRDQQQYIQEALQKTKQKHQPQQLLPSSSSHPSLLFSTTFLPASWPADPVWSNLCWAADSWDTRCMF